jgi:hypothetical protein
MPLFRDPCIWTRNNRIQFYPACGESLFGGIKYSREYIEFQGEQKQRDVKIYPKIMHSLKQKCRIEWLTCPAKITTFKDKLTFLENLVERLAKDPQDFEGFRVECRVHVPGI